MNILLIDDNDILRESIEFFLIDEGYTVFSRFCGECGLETFNCKHIDVVICDMIMPDLDGIEIIQRIREKDKDVKIISISGYSRQGGLYDYLSLSEDYGADAVLYKPFHLSELGNLIIKLTEKDQL